ncbi:MAG TPA: AraC family transcriptional regulator [Steroidobacteraceae bacterium]|nr:AraC family transcriptional regulator [Steroidobacteraceae bacterium]
MQSLAKLDPAAAQYLPNPQNVCTAATLEAATEVVSRNIYPHRLSVADTRGVSLMCVTSALDLGDCALGYVQYGSNVGIESGIIEEYLLVKSTMSGHGRVTCGDHSVTSTPRSIIMTSMTERTSILMSAQCRHLTARISRHALETRIAEKLGRRLTVPLSFGMEVASDSDFGRGWHQLLSHICHLSASAPSVLACEDVRKQYSRTMIELLVHSAPHNYSSALEETANPSIPWHVRRAREYVHAHIAEIRSIADIAAAIGITPRTLQNGFRQAFNQTPAEYVRQMRIQALHAALQRADSGQSVTDLMQAVGIVNFGRYARYYRQQIGVPPSVTLKRAM